jgi:uncharacterized membrane protein SpoIIM required for sporulation
MAGPELVLKSTQFRREREDSWRELEGLVVQVEKEGLGSLSAPELHRLPVLYRSALSSLGVASSISLDKNLLEYLRALVARAYVCVYGRRREAGSAVAEFFRRRWPQTVRKYGLYVLAAWLMLGLGTFTGYRMTRADPERYYAFIDEEMAGGRTPEASTKELRDVLYAGDEGNALSVFSTFLFAHNTKIGLACLALGFVAGVPVLFVLFENGLPLGALAALYGQRGLGPELWAWLLPHGVTELTAVALCGAAGLAIGGALLFPGRRTRLESVATRGREVAVLGAGAVVMFFIAGLIEGFFRQLVLDVTVRWALATLTLAGWSLYFFFAGRERDERRV